MAGSSEPSPSVLGWNLTDKPETSDTETAVRLSKPFQLNHFASVSTPQNTLCLTWGAKLFSSAVFLSTR